MIDIHCHILPEIDDGPHELEGSIEMAWIAAADGITTIVATPHIKHTIHPPQLIQDHIDILNQALAERDIGVQVLAGGDVYALLDPEALKPYTVNHTNYILIEFPHSHLPRNAVEIVSRFLWQGFWPIITHPERNPSVIRDPDLLFALLDPHVLVQVTADSVTGTFGPDIQLCANYLLEQGVVDILASDGHSAGWRPPVLSAGLAAAARIIGQEAAELLVTANPAAVIAGRPLVARP